MSDIDLYRQALGIMVACFLASGGALVVVMSWNARRVITATDDLRKSATDDMRALRDAQQSAIEALKDTLQKEMRTFDRRLTRLETIARVRLDDFEHDVEESRRGN